LSLVKPGSTPLKILGDCIYFVCFNVARLCAVISSLKN
jgi:hypothetical protein